jgi:ASC-1-like (ASCH) protein
MLLKEEASRIIPGNNREEVLKIPKNIYPPHKEQLGVLVLEIEPINRYYNDVGHQNIEE